MRKRNRVAIALLAILALASASWFWLLRHTTAEPILTDPGAILSVECLHEGGNATNDYEWSLTLDAKGNGTFTKWPSLFSRRSISISVPQEIPKLQRAVDACRLSQLPSQIGAAVADAGSDQMRIRTTKLDKTITIEYVQRGDENDDVRSAFRLREAIQRCAPRG